MERTWSEGLQRLVLAHAMRGELLSRIPGSLNPDLFGSTTSASPRRQIAASMAAFWERWRVAPSPEAADELVKRIGDTLSAPERTALEQEWGWLLETPLENPDYVYDQVTKRLEYTRLKRAMEEAAAILSQDPDAVLEAREKLLPGELGVEPGRERLLAYQAGAEDRLVLWRQGEEYGERIPTGLSLLDAALQGGPTRRESWYFLAPPKGAKTTSLLRVGAGAIRRGFGVYMPTFEMQAMRMMLRLDRQMARASKQELRDSTVRLEKALEGLRFTGAGELWVEEKLPQQPGSVREAAARVEKIRKEGGRVDVVILDYLNIMGASKMEREKRLELARISRDISAMAKDLDVLIWSAALVNRQAVNKRVIRKTDIAEAFEVIAVCDGMVAICGTRAMIQNKYRRFFVAAAREEQDEVMAGDYIVDFEKMTIDPADTAQVEQVLEAEDIASGRRPQNGNDQG